MAEKDKDGFWILRQRQRKIRSDVGKIHPFNYDRYIGRKYGRLTIIGLDHSELQYKPKRGHYHTKHYVRCRCDCGNVKVILLTNLTGKTVFSCGCLYDDAMVVSGRYPIEVRHSSLRWVYGGMRDRCLNPKSKDWPKYGGRGITICKEWYNPDDADPILEGFLRFYEWAMANGYQEYDPSIPRVERLSIDRIDVDGPYAPWNCRWTNGVVQLNNKRNTAYIEDLDGEILTARYLEEKYGVNRRSIKAMRTNGYTDAQLLFVLRHADWGISKRTNGEFVDKHGNKVVIPSIEIQKMLYQKERRNNGTSV